MATRDTKLNIEVTAEDRASKTIRDVQADVDKLEQSDATVDVNADDNASRVIDAVESGARDLDGTDATVDVNADDNASRVIDAVESDARDLDGRRAKVTVDADDNASRELDKIEAKLRELDGRKASIGVGGAVAAGAAGGAAVGAGLPFIGDVSQSVTTAANLALQVQQVADMTGATLEDAAKVVGVWRDAGLEVDDLLDIVLQVNQVLIDQPDLARKLNIGGATDLLDKFVQAVQGIQTEYDTAGSRAQASSQLFGEEGVRQVGRVKTAVGDFAGAVEQRRPIVDEDDVERAREINKQLTEAKSKWDQVQVKALEAVTLLFSKDLDDTIIRALDREGGLTGTELLNALGLTNDDSPLINNLPSYINSPRPIAPPMSGGQHFTIINNPPGAPATTVEATRIYERRNDIRYS